MNPTQNPSAIRSKREITNTLLHLMKSLPYNEITVKQILIESHVARKTFYRNFSSKDDVLNAHIDTILYQYVQSLLKMPSCQLENILDIIFDFCTHNQVVNPDYPLFQPFSPEEVEYIIAFNVGAAWNIILKWIEKDMNNTPEYIKKTIMHYLNHMSQFT